MTREDVKMLEKLSYSLRDFLRDKCTPHDMIIVTDNSVTLYEGRCAGYSKDD
jgi:hypothetical protein